MKEDIKTIQEKLKIIESLCTDDCINKSTVIQPLIYAIQNLIARYKELEEENKRLKIELEIKKYCKVNELTEDLIYYKNLAKEYQGNCIPKSKVKEKFIYYQNLYKQDNSPNEFLIGQDCLSKLSILQELLED